jgi:hypothetical protein
MGNDFVGKEKMSEKSSEEKPSEQLLTVNFHQPSYEFTFNVGIDLLF